MKPSLIPKTYDIDWITVSINCFLLYGFAAASLIIPNFIEVVPRGFFCDDDSIRYNYRPDTISDFVLVAYNLALNIITILVVELYRMFKIQRIIPNSNHRWRKGDIRILVIRFATFFGYSQIGFLVNVALFTAIKHMVGRLRPHFLDVCKLANDTCADANSQHRYIIDYKCNGDPALVLEGRKSFYSGHAALSFYSAVWSILYIQARFSNILNNSVFVPIIQTLILMGAFEISLSRITDNQHHWSDVSVGFFIGTIIAIYACTFWNEIFKNNTIEVDQTLLIISRRDSKIESRPEASRNLEIDRNGVRVATKL